MHNDLSASHRLYLDENKKRFDKNFKEEEPEKFTRLSKEYDLVSDSEHAEWYILYLR